MERFLNKNGKILLLIILVISILSITVSSYAATYTTGLKKGDRLKFTGNAWCIYPTKAKAEACNKNKASGYLHNNEEITIEEISGNVLKIGTSKYIYYGSTASKSFKKISQNIKVKTIKLNKSSEELKVGESIALKATISPSNATNKQITWASSNTKIVKVDSNGNIKAVAKGSATITATSKDGSNVSAKCTIKVKPIEATSVKLNKTDISLYIGEKQQLKATVSPSNAEDKTVTYTSSNAKIAKVDKNGNVTAVAKGKATITATTSNGKTAKCNVTIKEKNTNTNTNTNINDSTNNLNNIEMTLDKKELSIAKGNTEQLKVTIKPESLKKQLTNNNLVFESDNTKVATVDNNGNIKAVSVGTANIIVKLKDVPSPKKAKCKVTVTIPAKSIKLNKTELSLNIKDTKTLTATVTPKDTTDKVVWTSNDPSIASVDSNGKITAKKGGTVKIIAHAGSKKVACKVTVKQPITSIKLDRASLLMKKGTTHKLKAEIAPAGADVKIEWISGDTKIASVDSKGNVKAKGNGKTKITARVGNISASCVVEVGNVKTYNDMYLSEFKQGSCQKNTSGWRGNCAAVSEYYIRKLYGLNPNPDDVKTGYASNGKYYKYGRTDYPCNSVKSYIGLKNAIDNNYLVSLHVAGYKSKTNKTGTHWVVVIGYSGTGLRFNDYYFLDSWDGQVYHGANETSTINGLFNGKWQADKLTK